MSQAARQRSMTIVELMAQEEEGSNTQHPWLGVPHKAI